MDTPVISVSGILECGKYDVGIKCVKVGGLVKLHFWLNSLQNTRVPIFISLIPWKPMVDSIMHPSRLRLCNGHEKLVFNGNAVGFVDTITRERTVEHVVSWSALETLFIGAFVPAFGLSETTWEQATAVIRFSTIDAGTYPYSLKKTRVDEIKPRAINKSFVTNDNLSFMIVGDSTTQFIKTLIEAIALRDFPNSEIRNGVSNAVSAQPFGDLRPQSHDSPRLELTTLNFLNTAFNCDFGGKMSITDTHSANLDLLSANLALILRGSFKNPLDKTDGCVSDLFIMRDADWMIDKLSEVNLWNISTTKHRKIDFVAINCDVLALSDGTSFLFSCFFLIKKKLTGWSTREWPSELPKRLVSHVQQIEAILGPRRVKIMVANSNKIGVTEEFVVKEFDKFGISAADLHFSHKNCTCNNVCVHPWTVESLLAYRDMFTSFRVLA